MFLKFLNGVRGSFKLVEFEACNDEEPLFNADPLTKCQEILCANFKDHYRKLGNGHKMQIWKAKVETYVLDGY